MARVLVTGATGGFGLAIVPNLLARGDTVVATGRNETAGARLVALGAKFVPAELSVPENVSRLVAGADAVIHAAALSSPWGRAQLFERMNVLPTRDLLTAARAAGCERFVFISTPSIYAEARDRLDLTEDSALARSFPNAYAASKYAAERLVLAADAPGFSTVVLRPRALVGPDDRVLLPRLLRVARRGWFPVLNGGRALIDLTDVRDAAAAVIAALEIDEADGGCAINITGGQPLTLVDCLACVFSAFGIQPRLRRLHYAPAASMAGLLELICMCLPGQPEPLVTAYSLTSLAFSQTFDLTKAYNLLEWQPRHSPQEAIARTAAAWKHRAAL